MKPMAMMGKRRKGIGGQEVEFYVTMGNVDGKTAIITDDVMTSGSTLKLVDILLEHGAKDVYMAVTHPVLVSKCMDRLAASSVKELIVTNTVPVPEEKRAGGKVKVLSIAPLLARVIRNIHENRSVSEIFMQEKMVFAV